MSRRPRQSFGPEPEERKQRAGEGTPCRKKIPMRQCVGCREMRPKRELVRVVKSPEGEITLDFKGKAPGAAHMSARTWIA